MDILLVIFRLLLFVVFALAGVTKLADLAGARKALADFSVPPRFIPFLSWALPLFELTVAVALLGTSTTWWGAIGALTLLVGFLGGISVQLAKGNAPDCHCFGQLHSQPISWKLLVRNIVLAMIAGVIIVQGPNYRGASLFDSIQNIHLTELLSLLFSAGAMGLLIPIWRLMQTLIRQQKELQENISALKKIVEEDYGAIPPVERADALPPDEGLPVGALAPAFSFQSLSGKNVSLQSLLTLGKPVLILFVSPSCTPCKSLLPHLRNWQRDYADFLTFAVLSQGTETEVRTKLEKYEVEYVLLQGDATIADEYQAKWTPAAILIDQNGRIASPVTSGDAAIKDLVTHTVATANMNDAHGNKPKPHIKLGRSLFQVGEPAPIVTLPDLNGRQTSIPSQFDGLTLLLFWNPDCGFCQAMAEELRRWELTAQRESTQLIFIAAGEFSAVKKESESFRSSYLYDPEMDVARLFGANGTPSGILIDQRGNIASSLAVGESNIYALLGIRKIQLPIMDSGGSGGNQAVSVDGRTAELVTG